MFVTGNISAWSAILGKEPTFRMEKMKGGPLGKFRIASKGFQRAKTV